HSMPAAPGEITVGPGRPVAPAGSVIVPAGVMRPILPPADSVNHRLPSEPAAIAIGTDPLVGIVNFVGVSGASALASPPQASARPTITATPAARRPGQLMRP